MARVRKFPQESPLSVFLWGGQEKYDRRKTILEAFLSRPVFSKSLVTTPAVARKEAYTRAVLQARELIELKLKHGWSNATFLDAVHMLEDGVPVIPQFRIFLSNLERQMSDEQKAVWIPKVERFEIFGSYCQTELGHGSNVRAIETTATFDQETDEFVINSPTLSSTKFWIGATGVWATHSIVVARLLIRGKDYGIHLFLTQLRDLDTQQLMPGVEIYELGPKVFQGMLGMDNGAVRFQNVRIPRSQMLARNARVERDGSYVPPANVHHSLGSMVAIRALMAEITAFPLLRAASVAYHYTNFRRQFKKSEADQETVVFDYASVRYRLLPLLVQGTALALVGRHIKEEYDEYTRIMLETGDTSRLQDLHLQTVGAKVYSTEITGHGIETCRILCGGHGYSALSGFGRMYANAINAITYEGDNYVISQQIPRAVLKHWRAESEASIPSLSYLRLLRGHSKYPGLAVLSSDDWLALPSQRWLLEQHLAILAQQHIEHIEKGFDTSFSAHHFTMAHSDFVYWNGLWKVVEKAPESFKDLLTAVAQLFSLSILINAVKDVAGHNPAITSTNRGLLKQAYDSALTHFAQFAGTLVEGFDFTEFELDSALARSDTDPYQALMMGARDSEINASQHLWPVIVGARSVWKEVNAAKL
ncbi:acyl-CoA dehydrogenase/oxidase C-terminal [Dactylonectria macrodidyma]|uniref:Acyl-coenzyme A oxidase n=1 Tax=Dactylonectria macrodidyma TaxID=307937 RepID=A0A9P9I907_9HYPO|nr:acyl-CoA dehydrogenase/oxidase C-terminal [Dactylonectria macrodidyma]KAH7137905.1 acyl-CoA dehydrogenase/oxidase C-terminal [Dactylonectria macrodidyma]